MTKQQAGYLSYLLRLWRVSDQQGPEASSERVAWRASLEDPRTGELHKFASLEEVFDFLRAHMELKPQPSASQTGSRKKPA